MRKSTIILILSLCFFSTNCKTPQKQFSETTVTENRINPSFSIGWSPLKMDTVHNTIFILDTMINVTVRDSTVKNVRVITQFDTLQKTTKLDVDFEPIIYYDTVIKSNTITKEAFIPKYIYILIGMSLLVAVISLFKR